MLATDNRIRVGRDIGGAGDWFAVDEVIVSDVLHEYTNPTAPTNLSVDTPVEGEIMASWTNNATFLGASGSDNNVEVYYKKTSASEYDNNWYESSTKDSHTFEGLLDGEKYDVRISAEYIQHRHGERRTWFDASAIVKQAVTLLPAPTSFSISTTPDQLDLDWNVDLTSNVHIEVSYRNPPETSWKQDGSNLSETTTSYTTTELIDGATYEVSIASVTEHTTSRSTIKTATVPLIYADELQEQRIEALGSDPEEIVNLADVAPLAVPALDGYPNGWIILDRGPEVLTQVTDLSVKDHSRDATLDLDGGTAELEL
jgi:hypothetical protein